jgi:hypothetical protein
MIVGAAKVFQELVEFLERRPAISFNALSYQA